MNLSGAKHTGGRSDSSTAESGVPLLKPQRKSPINTSYCRDYCLLRPNTDLKQRPGHNVNPGLIRLLKAWPFLMWVSGLSRKTLLTICTDPVTCETQLAGLKVKGLTLYKHLHTASHIHAQAHTHTNTQTHSNRHTHTHTHTHSSPSLSCCN
jgi:hypothetical protein